MKLKGIRLQMLVAGILIIGAGKLLLMFNNDMLPIEYKSIIFSWQMLLIAIGLTCFFHRPYPKIFLGIKLMIIGAGFMFLKFDCEPVQFIKDNLWAVLLIMGGLVLFLRAIFHRQIQENVHNREQRWHQRQGKEGHSEMGLNDSTDEAGYISYNCIFGGGKERVDVADFKGGEINCLFGGMELDLTRAHVAEGVHQLSIKAMFGGVVLIVPSGWKVELRKQSIFGNFEDRRPRLSYETNNNKLLVINVLSIFGGGEIKSYG